MNCDNNILVELCDVCKKFDGIDILKNIFLQVKKNDFIVIKGRSGSGKSTLLNIIGLLSSPSSGQVFISGENTCSLSNKMLSKFRRDNIGFVFQDNNLLNNMSVYDNLMLLEIIKNDQTSLKEKINYYLDKLEINYLKNKKANELSGGEKQRVSLIRSLLLSPSFILADEPTGNLDDYNENIILNCISEFVKSGGAAVVVTHGSKFEKVCNSLYKIENKQLIQY